MIKVTKSQVKDLLSLVKQQDKLDIAQTYWFKEYTLDFITYRGTLSALTEIEYLVQEKYILNLRLNKLSDNVYALIITPNKDKCTVSCDIVFLIDSITADDYILDEVV